MDDAPRSTASLHQGEDSYEAALRAADALFAGSSRQDADEIVEPDNRSPTGGRILRVIEEAPPQALLDLEAERAPKRRGRKPGSKNKPKVLPHRPALQSVPPTAAIQVSAEETMRPGPEDATMDASHDPSRLDHAIASNGSRAASFSASSVSHAASAWQPQPRRGARFAWVRTTLKPGEEWKRRLPKVIW